MNLTKLLNSTLLFNAVQASTLALLAQKFTQITVPAHEILIHEGEHGDSLYLLHTGALEVFLKDDTGKETLVAAHHPGEIVGEISLLTGAIRSATVRTTTTSHLWQLTRHDFEQVAGEYPGLRAAMERALMGQLHRAQLRAAFYENRLFAMLDEAALRDLEQALELIVLAAGELLLRAGEPSEALYLVLNGRLRVVRANDDEAEVETLLNEVGSGQIVGEMGLITGEPRSATIYAARKSLLGRLDADAFYRLLQKHPQALTRLVSSRIIADLHNQRDEVRHQAATSGTMAIVALGSDIPLAKFADQLAVALAEHGSALHISAPITDAALGQADIAHAPLESAADLRVTLWFAEQEARHDYLIYSCTQDATTPNAQMAWTQRCLRQADRLVYLAWADSTPQAATTGTEIKRDCSLVLLHPPQRQIPVGSGRWLDAIRPVVHHHVRWADRVDVDRVDVDRVDINCVDITNGDIDRLARLLTGRGIGLVLSGGGARGFAHVGAIRALQEANIPIDLIGGVSFGAIIGGLLAIGHDADSMTQELAAHLGARKQLIDVTLPLTSLFAGKKLERLMHQFYGGADIVDTWQNFFCITTDITRGAEVTHRRGPLWQYIRASSSLPVAFPPQVDGDNLLIDGCIMNNYPVDVMRRTMGCGVIIGVNVCQQFDMRDKNQYGNSLSGWEILNGKFNPIGKPVSAPNLFDILNRLTELNGSERLQEQVRLTDLYIRPPVHQFSAQGFEQQQEIIDAGYRAAQAAISEWLTNTPGQTNRQSHYQ